jgi:hypothetical protein
MKLASKRNYAKGSGLKMFDSVRSAGVEVHQNPVELPAESVRVILRDVHVAVPVDAGANFNIRDFKGSVFAMSIGGPQRNQQHDRTDKPEEFEECSHDFTVLLAEFGL